jgi:hypothetical protein
MGLVSSDRIGPFGAYNALWSERLVPSIPLLWVSGAVRWKAIPCNIFQGRMRKLKETSDYARRDTEIVPNLTSTLRLPQILARASDAVSASNLRPISLDVALGAMSQLMFVNRRSVLWQLL